MSGTSSLTEGTYFAASVISGGMIQGHVIHVDDVDIAYHPKNYLDGEYTDDFAHTISLNLIGDTRTAEAVANNYGQRIIDDRHLLDWVMRSESGSWGGVEGILHVDADTYRVQSGHASGILQSPVDPGGAAGHMDQVFIRHNGDWVSVIFTDTGLQVDSHSGDGDDDPQVNILMVNSGSRRRAGWCVQFANHESSGVVLAGYSYNPRDVWRAW